LLYVDVKRRREGSDLVAAIEQIVRSHLGPRPGQLDGADAGGAARRPPRPRAGAAAPGRVRGGARNSPPAGPDISKSWPRRSWSGSGTGCRACRDSPRPREVRLLVAVVAAVLVAVILYPSCGGRCAGPGHAQRAGGARPERPPSPSTIGAGGWRSIAARGGRPRRHARGPVVVVRAVGLLTASIRRGRPDPVRWPGRT
jgi:hypothetical protein